jgi:hypothetical protein
MNWMRTLNWLAGGPELRVFGPAGDEGRLVAELRSLKSQRSRRAPRVAKALEILEKTNSARVRNAAALALADLRTDAAKDRLIDLLSRPDTTGSRGSLLYALDRLGADVPLAVLAEIIVDDAYEAREEALTFIRSNRIECSAAECAHAKAVLEEAANASAEAERLRAIHEALDCLRAK